VTLQESFPTKAGKGKITPLQARLWPRGGRGIALLFQDLGARRGTGPEGSKVLRLPDFKTIVKRRW